jgi:tetraacyldisaccharide 4'-kinase
VQGVSLVDDWYLPRLTWRTAPLVPLSWITALVLAFKRPPTRGRTGACPIVVIGNVTVGGTGKTPLTLHLADALSARGWVPGVVSRGYPASPTKPKMVAPDADPRMVGDEPLLYAQRGIPSCVCAQRTLAVEALRAQAPHVNIILADDALQHTALPRDVEICVVDGRRGFGNGHLLPAGPLREPAARIDRCNAVVITEGAVRVAHDNVYTMQLEISHLQRVGAAAAPESVSLMEGKNVALVTGIGHPQRFATAIQTSGVNTALFSEYFFKDHHAFAAADFAGIQADVIVMTQKDAVKCAAFASQINTPMYAAVPHVTLTPDLVEWLLTMLKAKGYGLETA